jgi:hypothetical protein
MDWVHMHRPDKVGMDIQKLRDGGRNEKKSSEKPSKEDP